MQGQNPEIRKFMDAIPLSAETKKILDEGSTHPSSCRCDVCLKWWRLMTAREDEDFGPFTCTEVHGLDPDSQGGPLS